MKLYQATMMGLFYDNLIPSGTKMNMLNVFIDLTFYDNLIPSGTKMFLLHLLNHLQFYDNLIPSGTKILSR